MPARSLHNPRACASHAMLTETVFPIPWHACVCCMHMCVYQNRANNGAAEVVSGMLCHFVMLGVLWVCCGCAVQVSSVRCRPCVR